MKVIDALRAVRSVVDNDTISIGQPFLLGNGSGGEHEVPKERLVFGCGLGELGETVAVFWNHQKVNWALGADIAKGQAVFVFVDDFGRDGFVDDLIKDRRGSGICSAVGL